jgi:protein-L-isoaspartate(D-aspartate) O-methyltransferase
VTAGTPQIPRPLLSQLRAGGRLVVPIGEEDSQTLLRLRVDASGVTEEYIGDCRFVKLLGRYGFAR